MTTLTRKDVFFAIEQERDHQDKKWGTLDEHPHEVGSWLTIMRQLLNDAERAYMSQRGVPPRVRKEPHINLEAWREAGSSLAG